MNKHLLIKNMQITKRIRENLQDPDHISLKVTLAEVKSFFPCGEILHVICLPIPSQRPHILTRSFSLKIVILT